MNVDVDLAPAAALLSEPARVTMLLALSDGRALPAGELARRSRIAPPTASEHLAKLVHTGVLAVERVGRHRYYRLSDPATLIPALEALAVVAHGLRPSRDETPAEVAFRASAIRRARTCYDHLAGVLGVELTSSLVSRGWMVLDDHAYDVTEEGSRELARLGVDVGGARRRRRAFAPTCLDWSERRYHLAGALGAAISARLFALAWIERIPGGRVVKITGQGRRALRRELGIEAY